LARHATPFFVVAAIVWRCNEKWQIHVWRCSKKISVQARTRLCSLAFMYAAHRSWTQQGRGDLRRSLPSSCILRIVCASVCDLGRRRFFFFLHHADTLALQQRSISATMLSTVIIRRPATGLRCRTGCKHAERGTLVLKVMNDPRADEVEDRWQFTAVRPPVRGESQRKDPGRAR
jgi:hypothetical protein